MKHFNSIVAAREAVSAHADRPATAIVHDTADARLVMFRLSPGQAVKPHRSNSTVVLTVISGNGILSGERDGESQHQDCTTGDVVVYEPQELHGMRAINDELLLLATITPRPGGK